MTLRAVRAQDADALGVLFNACFAMTVDADYFDWKYFKNPAGNVTGFVADAGDRLGAFYGVIPEPWSVAGTDVEVHQSMDTMTHPHYRRRGLFVKLAQLTYEDVRAKSGPVQLVGIPGRESLPGLTDRLGWTMIHEFDLIGLPALLARAWHRYMQGSIDVEPVAGPDARVHAVLDRSPHREALVFPALVGEFFDWRVFGRSPKRLRVALATDHDEPVAVCVYALTSPRTTMISYLASISGVLRPEWFWPLLRFVSRQGGPLVYTWRPQHHGLASLYKAAGFRRNPLHRRPLSERWPLTVKSDTGTVAGVDWTDPKVFDLQPLMQD